MDGLTNDAIAYLKKHDLYEAFYSIAKSSSKYSESWRETFFFDFTLKEGCDIIINGESCVKTKAVDKINMLINMGFIIYTDGTYDKANNLKLIKDDSSDDMTSYIQQVRGHREGITDQDNEKLILSENADISGKEIYRNIYDDEQNEILIDDVSKTINNMMQPLEDEYKEYVDKAKDELKSEIKNIKDTTVKSIEIISIFTAVISLILTNVIGIVNSIFTVTTIIIINLSTITSIFFLLLFTKLLIRNDNLKGTVISFCIMIVVFICFVFMIKCLNIQLPSIQLFN